MILDVSGVSYNSSERFWAPPPEFRKILNNSSNSVLTWCESLQNEPTENQGFCCIEKVDIHMRLALIDWVYLRYGSLYIVFSIMQTSRLFTHASKNTQDIIRILNSFVAHSHTHHHSFFEKKYKGFILLWTIRLKNWEVWKVRAAIETKGFLCEL